MNYFKCLLVASIVLFACIANATNYTYSFFCVQDAGYPGTYVNLDISQEHMDTVAKDDYIFLNCLNATDPYTYQVQALCDGHFLIDGPPIILAEEAVLVCDSPSTDIYNFHLVGPSEQYGDSDGVQLDQDNCAFMYNPNQCDTDGDGWGNVCDGDFSGDGTPATSSYDFTQFFLPDLGTGTDSGTGTDMSCNGGIPEVSSFDFTSFFLPQLGRGSPGPTFFCRSGNECPELKP